MFKDEEDFLKALSLIDRYSEIHAVKVQGYSLMNNHGHWMFEASTEESISDAPELLVGPLDLPAAILSRYFRAGPVNWTPRSGLLALHLDERKRKRNPGADQVREAAQRAGVRLATWESFWLLKPGRTAVR